MPPSALAMVNVSSAAPTPSSLVASVCIPHPPPCMLGARAPKRCMLTAQGARLGPQPPWPLTVCAAVGGRAGGTPSGSNGTCRV